MGLHSLPSPPAEDHRVKKTPRKSSKSSNRPSKRASIASYAHHHDIITATTASDGHHNKRVWKACERCRMKKTKCDGEFPCKRCKDDGLVCTAGIRKKMEYKQLPRGYAQVLENTQLTLVATIHKLYSMVRNSQPWELGETDLNERGQPVVHDIAQRLGCIRPNSDIDLPRHSVFPEDEPSMAALARQLQEQQLPDQDLTQSNFSATRDTNSFSHNRADRASSSDLDPSDVERDYRQMAFSSHNNNALSLSPPSFASGSEFELTTTTPVDLDAGAIFPTQPPSIPNLSAAWAMAIKAQHQQSQPQSQQPANAISMSLMQQQESLQNLVTMMRHVQDAADFGTIKPNILSYTASDVIIGMADPMIYAGYENESMRL